MLGEGWSPNLRTLDNVGCSVKVCFALRSDARVITEMVHNTEALVEVG